MPNLNIYTLPKNGLNGHLYVTEVAGDDPVDKNDKILLFVFERDVTQFALDKILLSAINDDDDDISDEVLFLGTKLAGVEGSAVYSVAFRPPGGGGAGSITILVPENSVFEGNPETTLTITYSDDFPESSWGILFNADDGGSTYNQIVSIDSDKVWLRHDNEIHVYDWTGTQNEDETAILNQSQVALRLDAVSYLVRDTQKLTSFSERGQWESADILGTITDSQQSLTLKKDGTLLITNTESTTREIQEIPIDDIHFGIIENNDLSDKTFGNVSLSNKGHDALPNSQWNLASDLNGLYIEPRSTGDHFIRFYDSEYGAVLEKWIPMAAQFITYAPESLFTFRNFLFRYDTNKDLRYLDTTKWQVPKPLGKIHPQRVVAGQRIDLNNFIQHATEITFDLGFKIPDWVSLENDRYLVISDDAPIDATSYIRIIGINHVGASPFRGCMFYIHVENLEKKIPIWQNVEQLAIRDDQEINLFEYVKDADTIESVYGSEFPDFLELENGVLRIIGEGEFAALTLRAGTHDGFFSDRQIAVTIISDFEDASILNVIDYNVEIEGIDVTDHLVRESFPSINQSLDWLKINHFKRGRCNVSLYSNAENNGIFNATNPISFWKSNNLNENGFLNTIAIFVVLQKENGTSRKTKIFDGVIRDSDDSLNAGQLSLGCVDTSYILKDIQLKNIIRGVKKTLELEPSVVGSDEPTTEGIYRLENTFGEMIAKHVKAWNNQDNLTLKKTENLIDGVVEDNTAFATDTEVRTQGGYLHDDVETPLLIKTETPYRYLSVSSAVEKYIKNEAVKMTLHLQETDALGDLHIRANGNLSFATEKGRILKYPVDWIVDTDNSKLYYLLSNPSSFISDELICYDLRTESRQTLHLFDQQVSVLKLATSDFDTFAVMLKDATGFDRSVETPTEIPRIVKEDYDSSLSEKTQIITYQQSEDLYKTLVPKNADERPLSALHYWTGVSGKDFEWAGVSEGDRGTFAYQDSALLYRWTKGLEFGVASVASDGTITELFTEIKDDYFNHLNFAFDIVGNDTYFAFVSGTENDSTLTIKKISGGNTTTILERTLLSSRLDDLDQSGNTWLGVQELLVDEENFYLIVPVSRNNRDISTSAGVILYRYSIVTQQLTPLSKNDFVQHGSCMLTKFDDDIYFVESPTVTNEYPAHHREIEHLTSESKGFLYRIRTSVDADVETIGNIYFDSGKAYNSQLPMKALDFDEDLNFIMGYGDIKSVSKLNSEASNPENWQWLSFGKKHRYKVPVLKKEGEIFGALTQIAGTIGGTISIDKNVITIQNRQARGAVITFAITSKDTEIPYDFANVTFPEKGYLLIGSELVKYTGKTDTHFTGITRGFLSTDIQDHEKHELITFVKRTIEDREKINSSEPYLQVTVSLDSPHLYNSVSEGSPERINLEDEESQKKFGERGLHLNLGTTEHEIPYSTFISEQYLQRFKDLSYIVNTKVRAFFSMNLGEFVCFKCLRGVDDIDGYLIAMQVMSIQTDGKFTTLRGRQVTPVVTPVEKLDIANRYATDGGGALFFADGNSNVMSWYGSKEYIDISPSFDVSSLEALQLVQYNEMSPIVFPEAKSPIGNTFIYSISPTPESGLSFNPKTRILSGVPNVVQEATNYTYTATDSEGQIITLTRSIEVLSGVRKQRLSSDGREAIFFADGNGNIAGWYGH